MTELASPGRLHLQVFTTSWRFILPRVYWPCFVPDPLVGFPLQSFAPFAQSHIVSDTAPLLPLDIHRFPFNSPSCPAFMSEDLPAIQKEASRPVCTPRPQGLAPRESLPLILAV